MLGGLGLAVYYMVTETGPYRWLAALQFDRFGSHQPGLTMLALFGGAGIAAALVAAVVRKVTGIGAGAAVERKSMAQSTQLWLLALASAGFAIGTVIFARSAAEGADLPPAEVDGVGHTDIGVAIQVDRLVTLYFPITPRTWRAGEPVAILGKHVRDAPVMAGPPWHGALLEDQLPAIARAAFEKRGVVLASPVYVLDPAPMAGGMRAFLCAVLFGAVALSCFLALITLWLRGRKAARRVMARAAGGPG